MSQRVPKRAATLFLLAWLGMIAAPAAAADRETRRLVTEANHALAGGQTDEAVKLYDKAAEKVPDSPELAYDRGVAFYRQGNRAQAAEQFRKALSTRDIKLEAKAKFNLGNCAYAEALAKKDDLKAALDQLQLAVAHYRDAIAADPQDVDAKVNMETAQLFMKHLLDQEKNRQEEEKKNPQSQPSSQPESQPTSQPDQPPQSQPASRPQSAEQNSKQGQKKKEKQAQQGEQQQAEKQEGDQDKSQQGKQLEAQKQQGSKDQKGKQQAAQVQVLQMTPEEAEKLLQKIRDREQQRREALLQLQRSRQAPVDKDW